MFDIKTANCCFYFGSDANVMIYHIFSLGICHGGMLLFFVNQTTI